MDKKHKQLIEKKYGPFKEARRVGFTQHGNTVYEIDGKLIAVGRDGPYEVKST